MSDYKIVLIFGGIIIRDEFESSSLILILTSLPINYESLLVLCNIIPLLQYKYFARWLLCALSTDETVSFFRRTIGRVQNIFLPKAICNSRGIFPQNFSSIGSKDTYRRTDRHPMAVEE